MEEKCDAMAFSGIVGSVWNCDDARIVTAIIGVSITDSNVIFIVSQHMFVADGISVVPEQLCVMEKLVVTRSKTTAVDELMRAGTEVGCWLPFVRSASISLLSS